MELLQTTSGLRGSPGDLLSPQTNHTVVKPWYQCKYSILPHQLLMGSTTTFLICTDNFYFIWQKSIVDKRIIPLSVSIIYNSLECVKFSRQITQSTTSVIHNHNQQCGITTILWCHTVTNSNVLRCRTVTASTACSNTELSHSHNHQCTIQQYCGINSHN